MYQLINKIKSPSNIRSYTNDELKQVAEEARCAIINRVSKIGGHFGSNMGMVYRAYVTLAVRLRPGALMPQL